MAPAFSPICFVDRNSGAVLWLLCAGVGRTAKLLIVIANPGKLDVSAFGPEVRLVMLQW